jgi:hypothetical protein
VQLNNAVFHCFKICSGSCQGLVLLVLLGVFLPSPVKRFSRPERGTAQPETEIIPPRADETQFPAAFTAFSVDTPYENDGEPARRILYWYRKVLEILGRIANLVRPDRTLRALAEASAPVLGPAARSFMQLTLLVEKLIYSHHRPSEEDVETSRTLSTTVEGAIKGESL